MRVLVTGSRAWDMPRIVMSALDVILVRALVPSVTALPLTVVHGDCPLGADRLARDWANGPYTGWPGDCVVNEPHPAEWRTYGRAAGHIRNQRMVNLGADLCLAFFWIGARNAGTADCAERADRAGIQVRRITQENADQEIARLYRYPEGWLPSAINNGGAMVETPIAHIPGGDSLPGGAIQGGGGYIPNPQGIQQEGPIIRGTQG